MFRFNRLKSLKSGERLDFKLFNLQALQVPKGWDKLYVSVICVETGKTITKTGKASVRNGSCQWTENLSESIWISQHDASNELEECLFKLVVSMGSVRSGILGEAMVNLASYRSSKTAILLSLPLKKCNHGTIIQVKIQCLTPRGNFREKQREDILEDANIDYDDVDSKSDVSDSSLPKSVGSSSSNHLDIFSQAGELLSRDFSFSASSSRHSLDSIEGSLGREKFSPRNNLTSTVNNQVGRQDSTGSQSSHSSFKSKVSASQSSLQNQKDDFNQVSRSIVKSPLRNAGSSKYLLEAAEVKIEELRAESRMWEQNARKLMIDVEKLQEELSGQSNHQAILERELSESHKECDGLKQEIEHVKILLEESTVRQKSAENIDSRAKEIDNLQKELEDEVKLQRESNANLALQLKKTQESNIELVSVLQELEDTIEKQKTELANLSKMQSENKDVGYCSHGFENNGEIKPNEEVSVMSISNISCVSDLQNYDSEHDLGDLPAEDNGNKELQILKLQESQKNLESTIQSLEKSLHEKTHEIEAERSLKTQALMDLEAQWREKLAMKEEEIINLEMKLSEALKVDDFEIGDNKNLVKEVEVLKKKIVELEKDCNELTDENLELVLKLKESKRDLPTWRASSNSLSNEVAENDYLFTAESEVYKMNSHICLLQEELNNKGILMKELSADHLQIQCIDLEKKCADLELQLQVFGDKKCFFDCEFCKKQPRAEEQEIEINALHQNLESYHGEEIDTKNHLADNLIDLKISQSGDAFEMSKTLSLLYEQIHFCLANLKKQECNLCLPPCTECSSNTQISNDIDLCSQKEQAEAILNSFSQLKYLFEAKVTTYEDELRQIGEVEARVANADEVQDKLKSCNLEKNAFSTKNLGEETLQMKYNPKITDSGEEIMEKISGMDKHIYDNLLKDQEVEAPNCCQRELETLISNVQDKKRELKGNMEVMLKEDILTSMCLDDPNNGTMILNGNMMSSTCLDGSQDDKMLLHRSMKCHASADNFPAMELSELEISKQEVEVHLSELEKENVHLSERICGLEAQLRYLTDEKELSRLELQNSESCAINLKEEIRRLERELETQKVGQKQKLEVMQKQWLEAQEECEYLKVANIKLQITAESLIDECSLLQKSSVDLRKQNKELNEHCSILEAELKESQKGFSDMSKTVEALEGKYSLMLEEVASKERALCFELDALLEDNKKYEEKQLIMEVSMQNQMYVEKAVEVENLQREVGHLTERIYATHDDKERTASTAILELSQLRGDKAMLEASLQEIQGKLKLLETNLRTLQMESETKLLGLMDDLSASKQNQEILMADREKLLELLEDVKSNEVKHKSAVRGLELKLKAFAYERIQLEEEISSLRVQLQKTSFLQNEILGLKRYLNEVEFENQRLQVSFQILSGDYEELKTEKMLLGQRISTMQMAISELENCKRSKVSLEEKVLRLEGDLTAREALGGQDAELKNELAQVKRAKGELHRKIRYLQEENQKYIKRAQSFERKEASVDLQKSDGATFHLHPEYDTFGDSTADELKVVVKPNSAPKSSPVMGTDPLTKIQLLENELAEALEANDMYKAQLNSLLSEQCENHSNARKNMADEIKAENVSEGRASSLEMELRDLQDSYFHMSLKCAEVEAEREQLVLKLKAASNGRS